MAIIRLMALLGLLPSLLMETVVTPADATTTLIHDYSFNDGTFKDSIGTANGTLPTSVMSGLTSATFEGWFTEGAIANWEKVFFPGNTNRSSYVGLSTSRATSGNSSLDFLTPGVGQQTAFGPPLTPRTKYYFAAVLDSAKNIQSLYIAPVGGTLGAPFTSSMGGKSLSNITFNEFFIGRSPFGGNAEFNGSVDEFRIYNGALSSTQIAAHYAASASPGDINLTGYTLTFDDEFNTQSITTVSPKGAATWFYWPPYGAAGAFSSSQWDIAAFRVSGGILSDKAFLDTRNNWHSGNISSMDPTGAGFSQQWGYFEARVQMPNSGTGAWPAFWLGQRGGIPAVGPCQPGEELDVFEWYGVAHDNIPGLVQQASHNWNCDGTQDATLPSLYSPQTKMPDGSQPWAGYHIYGIEVDPVHITWYIDGVQTNQIATPTSHMTSPFYLMLDYALGGGWPLTGMVNDSSFNIDWVRVWALP